MPCTILAASLRGNKGCARRTANRGFGDSSASGEASDCERGGVTRTARGIGLIPFLLGRAERERGPRQVIGLVPFLGTLGNWTYPLFRGKRAGGGGVGISR